jgi:hypothetical protein
MSAIILNQIPTQINTVERLAAYSNLLLARLNPTRAVLEILGEPEVRAAFAGIGQDSNGNQRLICRCSLQIDPNYSSSTSPLWLLAQELSNVAIPPQYLAS